MFPEAFRIMGTINDLPSPKRDSASMAGRSGWYPYYAGFSTKFAEAVLDCFPNCRNGTVLDPWNGSGTTTAVTAGRGSDGYGYDLNPVMMIVARARLLNKRERPSLMPLAKSFVKSQVDLQCNLDDPLLLWFTPEAVNQLRGLEFAAQQLLLGYESWKPMEAHVQSLPFSDLVAFFYVALFRTVRSLLDRFQSSNPTWTKSPDSLFKRLRSSKQTVIEQFLGQIRIMENALDADMLEKDAKVTIGLAASQNLPLKTNSVDLVISSPPYCTRIDYAAATHPELAILGVSTNRFDELRRNLLGTPTVPKVAPEFVGNWGESCGKFLEQVRKHRSKASAGYYFKSHLQYFAGAYSSMNELARCLKTKGKACLIVQDSYYKDVHNDLPQIFCEMAMNLGMHLDARRDFNSNRNMGRVNQAARHYRSAITATESVLFFEKN